MPCESFLRKRKGGSRGGLGGSSLAAGSLSSPRRETQFGRRTRIRLQEFAHQVERLAVFFRRVRSRAIRRDHELVIAHVGVVRGEENAKISRDSGKDEFLRAQIAEKCLQRRREKAGMLRLEDKIVVFLRLEQRDNLVTPRFAPKAMLHLPAEIGLPAAKIVVHINDRDPGYLGALFEPKKLPGHRPRETQQLVRLRKIEIVDYINEQQRGLRFIWSAAVKISVSSRHDNGPGRLS
jgi:hypothetical protein